MADGDVVLDRNIEIDADARTRVELFAVEDSSAPGGVSYRFQYYDAESGESILRYDNAHENEVGRHHRHRTGTVEGIEFTGLADHVARFAEEVFTIDAKQ